ncbi:hypothetical protein Tco_0850226, partial [Tanacetum coccineum]
MAKQVELNKKKGKGTSQGENRPVWNNVQRLNHQNQFVPTAVLTRTGIIPVNTARHNFNSQPVSTSAARKVNVARPIVNDVRPKTIFHKTNTPIRRSFNRTTTPRTKFSNQKVNTAGDKAVIAVGGIRETAIQFLNCYHWNDQSIAALVQGRQVRGATYGVKLVSAASLINTAKPKLSTAQFVSTARQSWYCQAKLVLPGNVGAARHKVSAARQKFVLLVIVTTI